LKSFVLCTGKAFIPLGLSYLAISISSLQSFVRDEVCWTRCLQVA